MMVTVNRKSHFNAAHKLHNPKWTEEKNQQFFGKCSNPNYHGHNYEIIVAVKGEIDPDTGFVMNFTDLKHILKTQIIDVVDHKNLNLDIPFLADKFTSAEVMAIEFWKIISPEIEKLGSQLHCISLKETDNNVVEYFGE